MDSLLHINDATRSCNVPFYGAATYGLYGFIFADLIQHQFVVKRIKSNMKTKLGPESRTRNIVASREVKEGETTFEFVTKDELYCPLSQTLTAEVDKKWRLRKRKMTPSILPGIKGLWKFQQKMGRQPESTKEDFAEFTKCMTEADEELGLPKELVKSDFIR